RACGADAAHRGRGRDTDVRPARRRGGPARLVVGRSAYGANGDADHLAGIESPGHGVSVVAVSGAGGAARARRNARRSRGPTRALVREPAGRIPVDALLVGPTRPELHLSHAGRERTPLRLIRS